MITLTVNDIEVSVEPGTTIIRAAEKAGVYIPHFCYHPSLSIAGSCRMCLVEVEGWPRTVIACNQPVAPDMKVYTDSEKAQKSRQVVMEFQLLNHPLDCPVCDKAGECLLQDYSYEYGQGESRYEEPKFAPPYKDLGPNIELKTTRCIMCTRCVRFMREVAGEAQLAVIQRGSHDEIDIAPGHKLDHPLAGNVVDLCPVGCLLDKNFIHRTRVWRLENKESICAECSTGCNIYADSSDDKIERIRPRDNLEVNKYWICDTGRYANKKYGEVERLSAPRRKDGSSHQPVDWQEAFSLIVDGFRKFSKTRNSIGAIVSPYSPNETAFTVMRVTKEALNSEMVTGFFRRPTLDDQEFGEEFIIKGDKLPNQAGLQFVFGQESIDYDARTVLDRIESGQVKAAYIVHNDLSEIPDSTIDILKRLKFLVVEDIAMSKLAGIADVVLPGRLHFEKHGTFFNYQKRLQKFERAVAGPNGTRDTWEIMFEIGARFSKRFEWDSPGGVFLKMASFYPALSGLSHFKLDSAGTIPGVTKPEKQPVENK